MISERKIEPVRKAQVKSPEEIITVPVIFLPKKQEIVSRINNIVDELWSTPSPREGALWDNIPAYNAPVHLSDSSDLETCSKAAYDHLLFDLTTQVLDETYKQPDSSNAVPWFKPKGAVWSTHRVLPSSSENVKPGVNTRILRCMRLDDTMENRAKCQSNVKWTDRKRKERVDEVLSEELQEDEQQWVDYDRDELNIKMQLTNSLFDVLVTETLTALSSIGSDKKSSIVL